VRVEGGKDLVLRGDFFSSDIDGAGGVAFEDGIGKGDKVGLRRIEDGTEAGKELVIRGVI
jgi:hypothetical protein